MKGILVRDAKPKDLPEVVKINRALQYPKRTDGFLVCRKSVDDLNKLLEVCARFLVADAGGRVVGYLIALDDTKNPGDSEIFSFYASRYTNFIFIDQIGVLPDYQRQGVGRELYEELIKNEKRRILLDIIIEPRNQQSISFHEAIGFKSTGYITPWKNGSKAMVYEFEGKR